jgi:hypothetical protein
MVMGSHRYLLNRTDKKQAPQSLAPCADTASAQPRPLRRA